jgi:hypothetical protein
MPDSSKSPRAALNDYEKAVFVSYAWGGESGRMADELERAFAEHGIRIIRDIKDLDYKGSIEAFEQRIGQGQCIILIISDKYLRSEHCMYELVEADKKQYLRDRIFPVVLAEAKIYKAVDRISYIKHWDEQIDQLNQAIKGVKVMANMTGITADLDKYAGIRASFDHLSDLLSDMNALTPEMHTATGFSTLIEAVKRAMGFGENLTITKTGKILPGGNLEIQSKVEHGERAHSKNIPANIEPLDLSGQSLESYHQIFLAKQSYLTEFGRKINQGSSNLGILLTAQDQIGEMAKSMNSLMAATEVMDEKTAGPITDLKRISELLNTIYNQINSASGLVAAGENPTRQLNQISQNLPLLKELVVELVKWLENTGNPNH